MRRIRFYAKLACSPCLSFAVGEEDDKKERMRSVWSRLRTRDVHLQIEPDKAMVESASLHREVGKSSTRAENPHFTQQMRCLDDGHGGNVLSSGLPLSTISRPENPAPMSMIDKMSDCQ
jgi:hypothetical protein